jgi:hypothetical protein
MWLSMIDVQCIEMREKMILQLATSSYMLQILEVCAIL